jgi:hypothetical protein
MALGNYDPIIAQAARRFGVPESHIRAVMKVESGGNPASRSPKGAAGLMQIMPDTYADLSKRYGLGPDRFDPTNNIMGGAAYLGEMYERFGDWNEAIQAYNMGPGRAMRVRNGTATVPPETRNYLPKVQAALGISGQVGDQAKLGATQDKGGDMVPGLRRPQPGQSSGMGPMFGGARQGQSLTGLLEVDDENNFYEGLGGLLNVGQTPSDPPRTDPEALPRTTQTERMDLSGRINELMGGLSQPVDRSNRMGVGGMMMQGALGQVLPLAGERGRKVGIGELLGSLGAGLNQGSAAFQQQQRADRADQFNELGGLVKMDEYQRDEATRQRQAQGVAALAAQLRKEGRVQEAQMLEANPALLTEFAKQKFKVPEAYTLAPGAQRRDAAGNIIADNPRAPGTGAPPAPVTLGDGPQGPGVYARNPDGTVGPRLGASETAPGTEIAETVTPELAQERGLPPPPAASPYSNPNLSPRGRSNLVEAERKRWEKRATDNGEGVKSAQALITDMQRFQFLNSQTETGGVTGSPIGGAVRSLWDANIKEMNSIRDRITPSLRQPGSGATSDFDARMFQGGTVGVDKPKQVNDNIATGTIAAGQNLIAKAQFEQAYFDSYQHTSGMEAAWQKYLNDNPIFDPKADKGSYQLNANRVDWQTYFRNGMKAPEPGRPQAPMSGGGSNVPPPPPGATIIQ